MRRFAEPSEIAYTMLPPGQRCNRRDLAGRWRLYLLVTHGRQLDLRHAGHKLEEVGATPGRITHCLETTHTRFTLNLKRIAKHPANRTA